MFQIATGSFMAMVSGETSEHAGPSRLGYANRWFLIKKGRFSPALPLRHIERAAIWEGNYTPDIYNIGAKLRKL
jgi:hypothetical protein